MTIFKIKCIHKRIYFDWSAIGTPLQPNYSDQSAAGKFFFGCAQAGLIRFFSRTILIFFISLELQIVKYLY